MKRKLTNFLLGLIVFSLSALNGQTLELHMEFEDNLTPVVGDFLPNVDGNELYSADAASGAKAYQLDGTSGVYLTNGTDGGKLQDEIDSATVAFYIKPDADYLANTQILFEEGGGNGWVVYLEDGHLKAAVSSNNAGEFSDSVVYENYPADEQYHHVAAVWAAGKLSLYVDGILEDEATANFTQIPAHGDGSGIGYTAGGSVAKGISGNYTGLIDDFRLYDGALSVEEIIGLAGIVSAPNIAVSSGTFTGEIEVYINSGGADSILYTLDGSTPVSGSMNYGDLSGTKIVISEDATLKAVAYFGGVASEVAVADYVINESTDVLSVDNDTYVDESDADSNFEGTTDLGVTYAPDSARSREAYISFDLSAVGIVEGASIHLRGGPQTDAPFTESMEEFSVELYGVSDTTWDEATLTWNTKPAAGDLLGEVVVNGSAWFVFTGEDLTSFITSEMAAGKDEVNFVLKGKEVTNSSRVWFSDKGWAGPKMKLNAITSVPHLAVPSGTYTGEIEVYINAGASGADSILYTLDGSTPVSGSMNYGDLSGTKIVISEDATLKAVAYFGGVASDVAVADYVINESTDVLAVDNDTYVDESDADANFEGATDLGVTYAPDSARSREAYISFDLSSVTGIVEGASIHLRGGPQTDAPFTESMEEFSVELYGVSDTTWDEATLTWNTKPAAGDLLGEVVVNGSAWFVFTGEDLTSFITSEMAAGKDEVNFVLKGKEVTNSSRVWFSDKGWAGPKMKLKAVPTSTPNIAVASGTYTGEIEVYLNAGISGADSLFYTLDGSTPDASSMNYADLSGTKIVISEDATLKAVAYFGGVASDVAVADYVINESTDVLAVDNDTYVDESDADSNFEGTTDLGVTYAPDSARSREAYISFDLSSVTGIVEGASIHLRGGPQTDAPFTESMEEFSVELYGVSDTTWDEATLTWNTKPAAGDLLGEVVVNGSAWFVFTGEDLTSFITSEMAAGKDEVNFVLKGKEVTNSSRVWFSDKGWAGPKMKLKAVSTSIPNIAVASGTYTGEIEVYLNAGISGADSLFYTLDGSTPDASSMNYADLGGAKIVISEDATLKAVAYFGGVASDVAVADYVINESTDVLSVDNDTYVDEADPDANFEGVTDLGVTYAPDSARSREAYISFDLSSITGIVEGASIHLRGGPQTDAPFTESMIEFPVQLYAVSDATWDEASLTWNTKPAAGDLLDEVVVNGSAWFVFTGDDLISFIASEMAAGKDEVNFVLKGKEVTNNSRVWFSDKGWASPKLKLDAVPVVVANPVIAPESTTHSDSVEVTISTTTEGATIYYTTDGSNPDATSTEYTGAFTIVPEQTASVTVKAIAILDGNSSSIASVTYSINVSIEDIMYSNFNIYPNPVNEVLYISNEISIETGTILKVIDLVGKVYIQKTSDFNEINVSGLKRGLYFLVIEQENKIATRKFMKE